MAKNRIPLYLYHSAIVFSPQGAFSRPPRLPQNGREVMAAAAAAKAIRFAFLSIVILGRAFYNRLVGLLLPAWKKP